MVFSIKNSSKSVVSSKLVSQSILLFFCASYVLLFLITNLLFCLEFASERLLITLILAREDLHKNLVPKFINYNDRSILIVHNTPMAKTLFDIPDDKTCSIFDATNRSPSQVKSPYLELEYTVIDNERNNQLSQLTIDDLYYFSLGPYQIRNAISYYA